MATKGAVFMSARNIENRQIISPEGGETNGITVPDLVMFEVDETDDQGIILLRVTGVANRASANALAFAKKYLGHRVAVSESTLKKSFV